MFKLWLMSRPAWLSVFASTLMLSLWFVGDLVIFNDQGLVNLLQFDHVLITSGQWWRIFTGNFAHFTLYHTVMNAGGVLVVGVFFWPRQQFKLFVFSLGFVPVFTGLGLFLFSSSTEVYRGFSGALYGVLAMAFFVNLKYDRFWFSVALLGLAAKIIYEQSPWFDANYMQTQIGAPVASDAHLFGVLSGLGLLGLNWLWVKLQLSRASLN